MHTMETEVEQKSGHQEDSLSSVTVKQELNDAPHTVTNKAPRSRFTSSSRARVAALRTELDDKGALLACTWNELHQLLGQYQAELYASEESLFTSHDKYQNVDNVDTLKHELAEKDDIIRELEERLAQAESKVESVGLDLSVKNSLLNKYQQELLEKDAALMQVQTARHKLEVRNRNLELKLSKQDSNKSVSLLNAKRKSPPVLQGSSKRKALAPKPSAQLLCIDVEEETPSENAADGYRADSSVEPWPDGNGAVEATSQGSLPGNTEYGLPVDGSIEEAAIQGWELQPSTSADDLAQAALLQNQLLLAGDQEKSSPQHKEGRHVCPICSKTYQYKAALTRHHNAIHLKLKHNCPCCPASFTRQDSLREHCLVLHKYSLPRKRFDRKHCDLYFNDQLTGECTERLPGHIPSESIMDRTLDESTVVALASLAGQSVEEFVNEKDPDDLDLLLTDSS